MAIDARHFEADCSEGNWSIYRHNPLTQIKGIKSYYSEQAWMFQRSIMSCY